MFSSSLKNPKFLMMLGWSKNVCIFIYLMNCTSRLSSIIFFLFIAFRATIIPVQISLAKKTLPNFPQPNLFKILKFYFEIADFYILLSLSGDLVWFLRKEGRVFSLRFPIISEFYPELAGKLLFLRLKSLPLQNDSLFIPFFKFYQLAFFQ